MRWALIQPYWCVYERLGYRQVQSKGHVETQGADAVCRSRREALGGTTLPTQGPRGLASGVWGIRPCSVSHQPSDLTQRRWIK